MAARADSMAIIDSAVLNAQTPAPQPKDVTLSGPTTPRAAPPLEDETTKELTAEQKKTLKKQREIEGAQEDLLGKEQADALKEEELREKEQETFLGNALKKASQATKQTGKAAGDKIVQLPEPGSIWFPLSLLILFFFILLQFNGNTRIQWLWFVLTGNAHVASVSQVQQGGSGGEAPAAPAAPAVTPGVSSLDLSGYSSLSKGGTLGGF